MLVSCRTFGCFSLCLHKQCFREHLCRLSHGFMVWKVWHRTASHSYQQCSPVVSPFHSASCLSRCDGRSLCTLELHFSNVQWCQMLPCVCWMFMHFVAFLLWSLIVAKHVFIRFAQFSIFAAKCSLLRGAFFTLLLFGRLSTIWMGEQCLLPSSQIILQCSFYVH